MAGTSLGEHVARHGDGVDIARSFDEMRARGVQFLETPDSYYDAELADRVGPVRVPMDELRSRRILVEP